ncbi:gas vesicle protein GvpO [Kitasatospora sp. NPDC097605]|uniref:gas vesicle protein GvpO n=1 Tax=Kitasatospora sp. NPDC097605 TaxID=3157226 RepID=UPI0033342588
MPENEPRPRRAAPARRTEDPEPARRRPRTPSGSESKPPGARRRSSDPQPHTTAAGRRPSATHRAEPARLDAQTAAAKAVVCVQEMTGRSAEGITSLSRETDGWRVGVEVLETRRIPDSTDILAVYQVALDQEGELVSYRRERRYHRGRANEELS